MTTLPTSFITNSGLFYVFTFVYMSRKKYPIIVLLVVSAINCKWQYDCLLLQSAVFRRIRLWWSSTNEETIDHRRKLCGTIQ